MAGQTRKLSARAILGDMKAGLSDEEIMSRHRLRPDQFARICDKLIQAKLIRPGRSDSGPAAGAPVSPGARPAGEAGRASEPNNVAREVSGEAQPSPDHTEITRSLFAKKEATVQPGVYFAAIVKPGVSIYPESIGASEGIVYFFTDARGLNLWGIDLHQSEVKWRFKVGDWLESPVREHRGSLYFAGASRLYCVNGESGESVWIADHGILPSSDWVIGGGVCLHLNPDSRLTAVDLETGGRRWVSEVDEALAGSVLLTDGGLCMTGAGGRLYGLDALSGEEKWRFHIGEVTDSAAASVGKVIYAANDDGYLYALDSAMGEVIWRFDSGYGIVGKPSVGAGVVCVAGGDQALYGLDSTAGRQLWRVQLQAAPATSGVIGQGMLCSWTTRGELIVLDLTSGETKWTRIMGSKVSADPSLLNGQLLLSEREILRALDVMSGQENWRLELPDRVDSQPLLSAGLFLVKVGQRMLYAVDARGPGEDPDPRLLIRIDGEPQPKQQPPRPREGQPRRVTATKGPAPRDRAGSALTAGRRLPSAITLKIIAGIIGLIGFVLTFGWIRSWGNLSFTRIALFACSGLAVLAVAGVLFWLGNRLQRRHG